MGTSAYFREGTASQFATAKAGARLLPKSFYLVDGKPHLATSSTTAFAFIDVDGVTQMLAGIGIGGEGSTPLATQAGKAATPSGTVGTALSAAREDHTHPLQTTVSGNAGSANRLAMPRTIRLTGAVTGNAQFSGEDDCQITTVLSGGGSGEGPALWTGTASQLPGTMDPDTIYFVYE